MLTSLKIFLSLVILVSAALSYRGIEQMDELNRMPRPEGFVRELTETEQAQLYLFNKVSYAEYRVLKKVAYCESRWQITAFNKRTRDGGIFQINHIHLAVANAQELDVWGDWRDNIDFALELYEKNGLRDWNASRHCWR